MLDEKGTVLETVSNDTLGKIQFSPLTFETPKLSIHHSGSKHATDRCFLRYAQPSSSSNRRGAFRNLVATTQYDGGQVFTNHYTPEKPIESTTPPTSGTTDTTTNSTTETTSNNH